jgi:Flp pilus assembly protein TadB
MDARSRAATMRRMPSWKTRPPADSSSADEARKRLPEGIGSDSARAASFLVVVALLIRVGDTLPITALAAPLITVAGVVLVAMLVAELRARRRWTLR